LISQVLLGDCQQAQAIRMNSTHDNANDDQDWTPVVVKRRKTAATGAAGYQSQNRGAGSSHLRIVEESDVPLPPAKRLSAAGKTAIIQGRLAKKWSQEQLNKECNLPPGIINAIEAGRAQPSGAQLNAIARVLGVVLKFA
jgi:putative transcription factor